MGICFPVIQVRYKITKGNPIGFFYEILTFIQQLQRMGLVQFPCHSSSLIRGTVIDFGTFLDFVGTVHYSKFLV
jgi:hypothetical protein